MKILGIDPGLQRTGWGIITREGSALRFVACGVIQSQATDDMAIRLAALHTGLQDVVQKYQPDSAAIEETFVNRNPASALKLGQARGVAMLAPALAGIVVAEYAANTVKKALVGAGHADKTQVASMVKMLLPGCLVTQADAADALAVAICHAHYAGAALKTRIG